MHVHAEHATHPPKRATDTNPMHLYDIFDVHFDFIRYEGIRFVDKKVV